MSAFGIADDDDQGIATTTLRTAPFFSPLRILVSIEQRTTPNTTLTTRAFCSLTASIFTLQPVQARSLSLAPRQPAVGRLAKRFAPTILSPAIPRISVIQDIKNPLSIMAHPLLDTDAGSELFSSYEAELKLVLADLNQKLDQVSELQGEPRKSAVRLAERSLDEANELLDQMRLEKQNIPSSTRSKVNQRFRNYESDIDANKRKLKSLSDDRKALFGDRYSDNPTTDDQLEQRQQLLSGTDRLGRSSQRLRDSQRIALETEGIGRDTLADLQVQRETIQHTRATLLESEGYVDKSVKTLRGMARRMATNRVITVAIITVLVLLIIAVVYSKFR